MAQKLRRILFAVRDPNHLPRPFLQKAAALAGASGASLELFHAINEPIAIETMKGGRRGRTATQIMTAITERTRHRLERLARAVSSKNVRVRAHAEWDFPPHEAVVRRALAARTDLVIAATQPHHIGGRLLLTNTDWELIRHCPCPLLLLKSKRPYDHPAIVAAVDPFHAHAKPAALDTLILRTGAEWAHWLRGELHAFHAYAPMTATVAAVMGSSPMPAWYPPEAEENQIQRIRNVFEGMAKRAEIPSTRLHLRMGDIPNELAAVVRRTGAEIVVMGAVSRSGLKRLFIGSTAERALDRLSCDVLIVKPRSFKTTVPPRMPLSLRGATIN